MTPLHLMMLLHYHAISEPYAVREPGHRYSPAVCDYRTELFRWKLIVPIVVTDNKSIVVDTARMNRFNERPALVNFDHGLFTTTKYGAALVQELCNLGGTYGEQSETVSE